MSRDSMTPPQLFRLFEQGRITREVLHAAIGRQATAILGEIEDSQRLGPRAAIEAVLNRRAAAKLVARHGEGALREVFAALAEVENFAPALWLWNAAHRDVPFYCFLRTRQRPGFQVLEYRAAPQIVTIVVEHGDKYTQRESFTFRRDRRGILQLESRCAAG